MSESVTGMNLKPTTENPLYSAFLAICPWALSSDFHAWVAAMSSTYEVTHGKAPVQEDLIEWIENSRMKVGIA